MLIQSVKTDKLLPGRQTLTEVLDRCLPALESGTVIAITSKIVSICEGSVIPIDKTDKEELIKQQASYYLPAEEHKYGYHFSVVDHTLISSAGIDESNGDGQYVLWPKAAQSTANQVRQDLSARHKLAHLGVIITDSTSQPLRRGAAGICLAHSGFAALKDYRGTRDLFGREFKIEVANLAEGLAAAAVLTIGEGDQQTPLAVISDLPFIDFQNRNPNQKELNELNLTLETDYFEVFLNSVNWQKGGRGHPR